MKIIPCITIACLILTLSGCAVKSAAGAETVCDPASGPEPPQFCLAAELPPELQRFGLVPAGRLDKDTTGLLLITDDGDYVHRVITPKKHVPKVYFARTDGLPTSADAERFAQGVVLGDGTQCLPARLECLPEQGGCRVTVYEGKYHMVKRMLAGCGTPVLQLHRLSIGALTLDPTLAPGAYRELSAEEAMLVFAEPAS